MPEEIEPDQVGQKKGAPSPLQGSSGRLVIRVNCPMTSTDVPDGQISWVPKILSSKEFQKFRLPTDPNHFYIPHCPVPLRGVAHVTNAGRDAVDAVGACNERCWCVRPSRVVLTPRCWRQVCEKKRR